MKCPKCGAEGAEGTLEFQEHRNYMRRVDVADDGEIDLDATSLVPIEGMGDFDYLGCTRCGDEFRYTESDIGGKTYLALRLD